jgi:hypothetical protein
MIVSSADLSDTSTKGSAYGSPMIDDFGIPGIRYMAKLRSTHEEDAISACSIATERQSAAQ